MLLAFADEFATLVAGSGPKTSIFTLATRYHGFGRR